MKTRLLFCLALSTFVAIPTLQAAPATQVVKVAATPVPLIIKKATPSKALVRKLGSVKILRSGLAPIGPKRESCWVFWLRPKTRKGADEGSVFAVWKPTGRNRWTKLSQWSLGTTADYSEAGFAWLNSKTRTGWVMDNYVQFEGVNLLAFPQGPKTPANGLIKGGPYDSNSSSIWARYYEFGTDRDKRGFYAVTSVYSEPGQDEHGNTISNNERTILNWNGKGWDKEPVN